MNRRLVYIGNFKRPWTTETHYTEAFRELGWHVTTLQEDAAQYDPGRILANAEATQADLVLYTRTPPGLPPHTSQIWRVLEERGVKTASVHLDLFWGINREQLIWDLDPLFTTGTVFTADGDHDADWVKAGVNHKWLRAGVVRSGCTMGRVNGRARNFDVAFVGSGNTNGSGYHVEWPHRTELLRHMENYGKRYMRYGGGRVIRDAELNDVYRTIPIIVGDTLSLKREHARFWSDRVYETWGRGGFLLHPNIDALDDEFYPRGPMPTGTMLPGYPFGDFDILDERIAYWLEHAEAREKLRVKIQQFVRDHCTYTNRAAELLAALDLYTPNNKEHQA